MTTPTPDAPAEDIQDETPPEDAPVDVPGEDDQDPEGADQLGDPGKKALDAMRGKWKTERDKRRALEQQLAEQAAPGDDEDAETIRRQAEQAATARANTRIVKAEIKAAAAAKFADPNDALVYLDPAQFEVGEDGEVDADEIAEAITDLLTRKPYLAAQGGSTKRFQGTADSGARKGTGRPSQLTEDDVKRMSAAGKHAEIIKAREEGRLDDYLGRTR